MQISKISGMAEGNHIQRLQRKNKAVIASVLNYTQNASNATEAKFPYFMISFGSSANKEASVVNEYFRLPEGCTPDSFQIEAGKALSEGKDVLVEAPTGTGKTAIAHYAASKNMKEGKTTFYTTPLKALSNQKLKEFRAVYGDEKVGILTGDRRENVDAPIIIMTTEVYRNMALSNMYGDKNPLMQNLGTVIFDEFHYLGDKSRGPVWEESIMYTPKGVQTLELSATIGNPDKLKKWIGTLDENNVKLVSIPAEARYVPLKFGSFETGSYKAKEKKIKKMQKRGEFLPESLQDDRYSKPNLSDFKYAVQKLNHKEQLPAIIFVFSRKFSRNLQEYLSNEGPVLTTEKEQKEIEQIIKKYQSEKYIGSDINVDALKNGYAIHNAGIMPAQKELIEELFQKKLTKVVISTETLAAGINMPAKTVVISSPYKPEDSDDYNDGMRTLTSNEFKQMSGRAGRRGIDDVGYVYTMPTDRATEQEFLSLEVLPPDSISSRYNPDYAFISGFYEHNSDFKELANIYEKSFYANDDSSKWYDSKWNESKVSELINISRAKTNVLKKRGFVEEKDGKITLTPMGYMASKVRGYDALTLVETIADKKFANITPEVLAMVAGVIANPACPKDPEITKDTDLSFAFDSANDRIFALESGLESSIKTKLKMLGKDFDSFATFEDMRKFINGIKKPDIPEEELDKKMKELREKREKAETISKQTGEYTVSTLADAMMRGEVIPTQVLKDFLNRVEIYRKHISGNDIASYIEKLNKKLKEQNNNSKGNKAKARMKEDSAAILDAIQEAKNMQYLDEHLFDAIAENYRFLRKNPPAELKKEWEYFENMWFRLTAKDDLTAKVDALTSINDYYYNHNLYVEINKDKNKANDCIKGLIQKGLEVFETESASGIKNKPDRYGRVAAQSVYLWTMLNKICPEGMSNWNQLLMSISEDDADEGMLYRQMMQTADLVSQIGEIADEGIKHAQTAEDIDYYTSLRKTASEARNLLIKDPVTV